MSVTFNRQQLIKTAKQALAEHEKVQVRHHADRQKWLRDHADKATESTRNNARALRDALTKLLKSSGPIKAKDVYRLTDNSNIADRLYKTPESWFVDRNVEKPDALLTPAQVVETNSLLKVLEAATGDTVTANELKLLGLKNLGPVFAAAAAQSGKQVGA